MKQQIRYEISRIRTTRSTLIIFVLTFVLAVAYGLTRDAASLTMGEEIRAFLTPVAGTMLILPSILVAQTITHEYSDNAHRTSMILFPKRLKYLTIKWLAGTMIGLTLVFLAIVTMISLHYLTTGVSADNVALLQQTARILLQSLATFSFVFAFAVILKQTFLAVIAPTLILGIFEGLVGLGLKIEPTFLPDSALSTFSEASSGNWQYLIIYVLYVSVAVLASFYFFRKKDF